jgi:hypothetical protein
VYDPNVQIALLHDAAAVAHLTEQERSYFNHFITVPPEMYNVPGYSTPQYQRVKLCIDLLTPFEETMYMDADNIWFDRPVAWLYGEVCHDEFHISVNGYYDAATGKRTNPSYTYWWNNLGDVCNYWGITGRLVQTVSGWLFFRNGAHATKIFELARKAYDDMNAPCMSWGGGKPDEYCFNVALGLVNHDQPERHVFYFTKLHGHMEAERIYRTYWGLANGGAIVDSNVVILYNRLANKYCTRKGITTRRYHVDKANVIPNRT